MNDVFLIFSLEIFAFLKTSCNIEHHKVLVHRRDSSGKSCPQINQKQGKILLRNVPSVEKDRLDNNLFSCKIYTILFIDNLLKIIKFI